VHEAPLRDQPWTDRRSAVERRAEEPPLIEAVLRPGDCLYLPRGFLHAATALGAVSTHLTIGVHSWTRYALAEQALGQALRTVAQDPQLRASLPLGVDLGDLTALRAETDLIQAALVDAVQRLDLDQLSRTMQESVRSTQRAAPVGPLRQLRDADGIRADTDIVLRSHLAATLDQRAGQSVVRSRAGDFPVTEEDVAPLKTLLSSGAIRADDLGPELARRLVLAGLAVVG
jgi:ribosomal protein L16 Arg81 hydroxylase